MFRPNFRLIAICVLAAAPLFAAAGAQPASTVRGDAVVRYGDLDLASAAGARVMLARIERAAEEACGRSPYLRDPGSPQINFRMSDYRNCREQSVAQAVASLNAPAVTRLYAETRNGPARFAGR